MHLIEIAEDHLMLVRQTRLAIGRGQRGDVTVAVGMGEDDGVLHGHVPDGPRGTGRMP